jgi:hypothetical protein
MHRSLQIFALFVATAIAACASQSAPSGANGGSTEVVTMNGCRVDPARICNNVRGQNVTMSGTGLSADPRMVEQNSARTANIFVPVKRLNGGEIFEVEIWHQHAESIGQLGAYQIRADRNRRRHKVPARAGILFRALSGTISHALELAHFASLPIDSDSGMRVRYRAKRSERSACGKLLFRALSGS